LTGSPYWQQRFAEFGLSAEHLKTGVFPQSKELVSEVSV
jgi:hypothetical protein